MLLNRLFGYLGYERKSNGYLDFAPELLETIAAVEQFTMTSPERVAALVNAVIHIIRHDIPGDIVECGVWKGGSMMAVAHTLLRLKKSRTLWLFDTFEGMTPPTDEDRNLRGDSAAELLELENLDSTIWARSHLDEVKRNIASTGYSCDRVIYVNGRVEHTIPDQSPSEIALLRLDTDWYESTKHELVHLFPRLVKGGILIVDDYGHWQGSRKAVDEYVEEHDLCLLLCRIDYTGRIAVKC